MNTFIDKSLTRLFASMLVVANNRTWIGPFPPFNLYSSGSSGSSGCFLAGEPQLSTLPAVLLGRCYVTCVCLAARSPAARWHRKWSQPSIALPASRIIWISSFLTHTRTDRRMWIWKIKKVKELEKKNKESTDQLPKMLPSQAAGMVELWIFP